MGCEDTLSGLPLTQANNQAECWLESGWLAVVGPERWEIRDRLVSLGIPCHCRISQPLWVEIRYATDAIQFWAVMQRYQQSRSQLADRLTNCWAVRSPQDKGKP
jgi:hypothetical protein